MLRLHARLIIRLRIVASFFGLVLTACSSQPAPPTPDPFSSVAQQADAAYTQGMGLFQEGNYVGAQSAFEKAKLLSPTDDPRIDDMLQRTSAELTPTATPAPPTPVPTASPTPLVQSSATPATDLGDAYFGRVFIAIIPGANATPVPMTQFSVDDQIGLYIENLGQRLHLPFSLRVFDRDSGALVADTPGESAQKFLDNFVWYRHGSEAAGQYRLELYAGDVLTNSFDYAVVTTPVAIPTPQLTAEPTVIVTPVVAAPPPQPAPQPPPPPAPPTAAPPVAAPQLAPPPPPPTLAPAPVPTPTPVPPGATTISIAAGPSALSAAAGSDQVFVADRSGLVWTFTRGQPVLRRPLSVNGDPIGVAGDASAGRVYVAVRDPSSIEVLDAATGQSQSTYPLPSKPGDVLFDPSAGLLHVVLPDRDAIETIDVRAARVVRITPALHNVTGVALDSSTHTLYVTQLEGDLSILDTLSGAITSTVRLSDVGLAGVALGNDRVYAINGPGQELIVFDRSTDTTDRLQLASQPAALAVGPNTGAVYILGSDGASVTRVDADGAMTDVALSDSAQNNPVSLAPDQIWQRPRMTLDADEAVYVIQPNGSTLAIASAGS